MKNFSYFSNRIVENLIKRQGTSTWSDEWLMEKNEKNWSLVENINDAIFSLNIHGCFTYLSSVIEQMTSYKVEKMLGQPLSQIVYPEDLADFLYSLKRSMAGQLESFEFRILNKKGDVQHMHISSRQIIIKGQPMGLAGVLSDITKRKWTERQIKLFSLRDKLTGLYNRAYFEDEMKRLDTPRQLPLSIIMGDVNGLKLINDAFGHQEGDNLLIKIATILQESCRKEDVISRIGGDEFAIFLPRTNWQVTMKIIDRIKRTCDNAKHELIKPSIALGGVIKENAAQDLQYLLKEAEDRMYRNKLMEGKSIRASIISSLRRTLFEKNLENKEHTIRLHRLAIQFGRGLRLSNEVLDQLALLATLHDIGKVAIPEKIHIKPGGLSMEEWRIMWRHAEIGYRITNSIPETAGIAEGILAHHEWWDGAGYPRGLKGEGIPLTSRILSIVDAYDIMTHSRPYKETMDQQAALEELKRGAGRQFDPKLVEIFLKIISPNQPAGF